MQIVANGEIRLPSGRIVALAVNGNCVKYRISVFRLFRSRLLTDRMWPSPSALVSAFPGRLLAVCKVGLVPCHFRVAQDRLLLQTLVIKVLSIQYCGRVVAGDAILNYQGCDRRF